MMTAASNPDADAILVRRLLEVSEVAQTVDAKGVPRTLLWKTINGVSRVAVRFGSKNSFFSFLARTRKGTALHYAVELKNVSVLQALTEEGGADKKTRTGQGKTALELAYEAYGGRATTPTEIVAALR